MVAAPLDRAPIELQGCVTDQFGSRSMILWTGSRNFCENDISRGCSSRLVSLDNAERLLEKKALPGRLQIVDARSCAFRAAKTFLTPR